MVNFIYASAGKKISADEFVEALAKIKDFPGATGQIGANSTKNIENVCVWQVVQNGKFIPLTKELLEKYKTTGHL